MKEELDKIKAATEKEEIEAREKKEKEMKEEMDKIKAAKEREEIEAREKKEKEKKDELDKKKAFTEKEELKARAALKWAKDNMVSITMVEQRSTTTNLLFPNRTLYPETIGDWLMAMAMGNASTVPVNLVKWAKHYMK